MDKAGALTDAFQSEGLPRRYEEFFGGRLFHPWAKILLDQAAARRLSQLLRDDESRSEMESNIVTAVKARE